MFLYIGADHKGFELKEQLKKFLTDQGYQPQDLGNLKLDENDDYVDYAKAVGEKVVASIENARGILICGSGAGVDIAANKVKGVRSVLGFTNDQVFDARNDDDVNVLSIPSSFVDFEKAQGIVRLFLSTPFSGEEKHKRRIDKINRMES